MLYIARGISKIVQNFNKKVTNLCVHLMDRDDIFDCNISYFLSRLTTNICIYVFVN